MIQSDFISQHKTNLPSFDHRLYLASYDTEIIGVNALVHDMAETSIGVLAILELYCSTSYESANAYHGFHSVRQILDDINEVMTHLYANWELINPNCLEDSKTLERVIEPPLSRARAVISLLCSLHTDDEAQEKPETIRPAISSVSREIDEVSSAVTDFFMKIKQEPQKNTN